MTPNWKGQGRLRVFVFVAVEVEVNHRRYYLPLFLFPSMGSNANFFQI
jgi:hypothetical protein